MKKAKEVLSVIWNILDGKKTYIGTVIIFIAGGLQAIGKIDNELFKALLTFGAAVSAIGLRDAIRKAIK